jgi:hypothetical protein
MTDDEFYALKPGDIVESIGAPDQKYEILEVGVDDVDEQTGERYRNYNTAFRGPGSTDPESPDYQWEVPFELGEAKYYRRAG